MLSLLKWGWSPDQISPSYHAPSPVPPPATMHLLLLLLPLLHLVAGDDCMAGTVVVEEEDLAAGTWSAAIILTPDVDLDSWIVQIKFDKEVRLLL